MLAFKRSTTAWFMVLSIGLQSLNSFAAETLTVMTSYPEEVVSRFEEAFEKSHPDIQLQILWRRSHDALNYLQQAQSNNVDVYWTPAPENFLKLKTQKQFAPLKLDRTDLPTQLKDSLLADPDGFYTAHETAGYGLFVNPEALKQLGVNEPSTWQDLSNPQLQGKVILPVPSKVGYAPMLTDQLLQHAGWQAGWNTWQAIAANSQLVQQRGNFVTEEVTSGRAAVGLTMDFFAASTIASGGIGKFIYPRQTAFNPAHIAIFAKSQHPQAAQQFVDFILSDAGQTLLFNPAIRKLPVHPSVYTHAPVGYTNPFTLAVSAQYDPNKGIQRFALTNALFDAAITRPHTALIMAAQAIHAASKVVTPLTQAKLDEAKAAFNALPIPELAGDDALVLACKQRALTNTDNATNACNQAEQAWDRFFAANYAKAKQLADEVVQAKP